MANLVKVKYVGKKASAFDNIARSGVIWNGNGDVKEVTDVQAKQLLKFPDQWALVDPEDAQQVNAPVSLTVVDEDGDTVVVDPDAFKKSFENMTKGELVAYAKNKWNKTLDARKSSKSLIDQIEEWERDLDVSIGVAE
jgi:hypothetical protein